MNKKKKTSGPDRGSNPEPLAPKARIIPLDHQATVSAFLFLHEKPTLSTFFVYHNTQMVLIPTTYTTPTK